MVTIEIHSYSQITVFEIRGRFFTESIDHVNREWRRAVKNRPATIAVNCKNLESIDSSAVGTLVRFLNYAMEKDIELVFLDLSKDIRRLFVTAKLHDFFAISTSREFCSKHHIRLSA